LENDLHVLTSGPELGSFKAKQIPPFEEDLPRLGIFEAQDRPSDRALSATGLTD
jgi:hypothetical protein